MCKKMFIAALAAFCVSIVSAQNVLQITDVSKSNDIFSSVGDEAAVVIRCHASIPLTFSSSMDKAATPFKAELQGSDSIYYIAFPTGSRYRGRELTIYSQGYAPASYLLELRPKQLVSLAVIDPNAMVDAGCYRSHRNKGVEEIKNTNYEEARNQFLVARECSDVDKEENERNVALVDSLIYHRRQGDEAYKLLDYQLASSHYGEVLSLNPYDNYASNRNTLCVQNFSQECDMLFTKAEFYYTEKEYGKASELYRKVIDKECRNTVLATERLNHITTLEKAKKDHARVFTYEYRKDAPLGFSYGKYNKHKVGGFFQMDLNSRVFDAIRSDCYYGDEQFAEMNMSFGWTVKIASPVWIHFGPGVTGKMYYGTYADEKFPEKGYGEPDLLDKTKMGDDLTRSVDELSKAEKEAWGKANYGIAISPVIGVTVKYSFFALRLTYQYRWSTQSGLEEFIGKGRLSVGAGIAF